jgi:SpoIIAA-like
VVEPIDDMPAGTLGFRSEDELTEADFREVLAPALEEAVTTGEVRLLLVTPPNFGGSDVKLAADRVKQLANLGHRTDWKRIAVVTDSGWLRRSARLWSHMVPVGTKLFSPDEEPEARAWLLAD